MNNFEGKNINKKFGVSFKISDQMTQHIFGDTIDELIDGLEVLKNGSFINQFVTQFSHLTQEQLARLDTLILQTDNEEAIRCYAKKRKTQLSNPEAFEERVLRFKRDASALNYISGLPGVDLLKIKKAIFQTGNICEIIRFCQMYQDKEDVIAQEDIEEVEQMAINSKVGVHMSWCAKIRGTNIERLQKAVEDSGASAAMIQIAKVEGADINRLRTAIKKTGRMGDIKLFISLYGDDEKQSRFFFKK